MDIQLFTLDPRKVTKQLIDFIKVRSRGLITAYIQAATNRIPVRTGFLRGSFRRLADAFNVPLSVVPRTTQKEYYNPGRILKTPSSGVPFMITPSQAFKITGRFIEIEITNSIAYYRIMDFTRRGRGTPWGSVDAGHAAMLNRLEQLLGEASTITDTILNAFVITRISLGKNGGVRVSERRLKLTGAL